MIHKDKKKSSNFTFITFTFTKIKRNHQILHNLTFSLLTGVAGFDNPMRDVGSEETIRQIAQVDSKTVYDEEDDQDEEWHDDDQDDEDFEDLEDGL